MLDKDISYEVELLDSCGAIQVEMQNGEKKYEVSPLVEDFLSMKVDNEMKERSGELLCIYLRT